MLQRRPQCTLPFAAAFAFAVYGPFAISAKAEDQNVLLHDLLTKVRDTLADVSRATAGELTLKNATLTLHTHLSEDINGDFNLFIVTFGSDLDKEQTQSLTIELGPPSENDWPEASDDREASTLARAIVTAYEATNKVEHATPALHLRTLKSDVSFIVNTHVSSGASFELMPVTPHLKGSLSDAMSQTLQIIFCEKPCQ